MQADEKQLKSMGILMGVIFAGLSFTAAYGFFKQLPWWIYVLGSLAVVLGIGLYWKYKTVKLLPLH
ncbi:MAG: phosphate/sulfate permease [Cyclobacteriaceae bacterium]|jgi:phosphate/sulfate permease